MKKSEKSARGVATADKKEEQPWTALWI